MDNKYIQIIAEELKINPGQVIAASDLLSNGATVPFIARYRKEMTGTLDEVAITSIRDRLAQLEELDKRRAGILKSLKARELLSTELENKIVSAETLTKLEDIYLPFRPKRRTRGSIAKEKGLEPLAKLVFEQDDRTEPAAEAANYIDPEKGVENCRRSAVRQPGYYCGMDK